MEISGKVVVDIFDKGSEKEQEEAFIILGWLKMKLRKAGESLHKLEGKMITIKGSLVGSDIFEVDEYQEDKK